MNREKFIEEKIKEFRKEFNIKRPIELKRDNRLGRKIMGVILYRYLDNDELFYLIKCNFKRIDKYTKMYILHSLLHELGHIKAGHVGLDNSKCKLSPFTQEYQAEKFALLYLKNHYPKYYPKALNLIKNFDADGNYKYYKKAYEKLWKELKC